MAAFGRRLLLGLLGTVVACAEPVPRDDLLVTTSTRQEGDVTYVLASTRDGMDVTLTLRMELQNMVPSRPLPWTVDLSSSTPVVVLAVRPAGPGVWRYNFTPDWRYGHRGGQPDGTVYALPFRPVEGHRLVQGNFGTASHGKGSENEYAFDFAMPVGTTVCAAREGVVSDVRSDSTAGGPDPKFKHCDNYVMIRHADGTYAEYVHLNTNCVYVRVGQRVATGQPIGLSGVTGFTTGPHLHFCVFRGIDGLHREALPVQFLRKDATMGTLVEGQTY